jgi:hypothetical protein
MSNIVSERSRSFKASGGSAYRLIDLINQMMSTDDPEIVAMFEDAIEEAQDDFKEHITQCIDNAKDLELTIDAIDLEITRLKTLKEQRLLRAERLRGAVKRYLEHVQIGEMITNLYTIKIRKNPPSVEILDESAITEEYKSQKITISINKKLIAEHIKAGVVIDGARLNNSTRLEIK